MFAPPLPLPASAGGRCSLVALAPFDGRAKSLGLFLMYSSLIMHSSPWTRHPAMGSAPPNCHCLSITGGGSGWRFFVSALPHTGGLSALGPRKQ
jgi:hypothetical protein